MKILLVDDEDLALGRLERMVKDLGFESVSFNDSTKALEALKEDDFDMAILDINMPKIDGTTLAKEIKYTQPECFVVFQTAYEEYALKAYELGAIGYLLKPYSKEDLELNIKRAKSYKKSVPKKFMTKNGNEYYLVDEDDIFYIEADLTEVIIRSSHGFSYYNKKISQMEKLLDNNFFKIHRSYIINLNKIEKMKTKEQSKIEFSFK
ncbi:MAG: LytR/AlgR family response regulator transcription factor, partial [Campylobacterota bacterium]